MTFTVAPRSSTHAAPLAADCSQSCGSLAAELHPQPRRCPLGVCGLDNSGNSCYLALVEHLLHGDTRRELAK